MRPGTACRIGGDEFVVILDGGQIAGSLQAIADRILASMEAPFTCEGHTIVPQVTIGGVLHGRDGEEVRTLRQNADFALYHSKATGRGRFIEFEANLWTSITQRIQQIRQVEAALTDDRIAVHYQPIVRLDSGEIVGLEALARIRAADGRIVAASAFQEAMKDAHVACRLTERMVKHVSSDVRKWLDMGIPFQHVGLNVTTADFQRDDLADRLTAAFRTAGVPLKHVVLEVTETVFVGGSDNKIANAVERLRDKGLLGRLGRFRDGLCVPDAPAHLPGRRHQDRQVLRRPPGGRPGECRHRRGADRDRPQARDAYHCRRRGDKAQAAAAGVRVQIGAGLPILSAGRI